MEPQNFHLFGLRSIDADKRRLLAERRIDLMDMWMIDDHEVFVSIENCIQSINTRNTHLHVSLDIDFLDPDIARSVGSTVPNGATYKEVHLIMEHLYGSGLVGSLDADSSKFYCRLKRHYYPAALASLATI